MNIGNLKRNDDGVFTGRLVHPDFSVTIYLASVTRTKERSPVCDVMGMNPSREWAKLGSLFEQAGRETGLIFYQGSIIPPKTDGKRYYIKLFRQDDGSFNVSWDEPAPARRATINSADMGEHEPGQQSDDGLGESTAPNGGLPPIPAGAPADLGSANDAASRRGKATKANTEEAAI
ncbi:MAG: DUF736 domain-containing protein [Sphingopyxis sp.]|uniref:DUF736 domain-containing protein n=1 Tax=Sphingopyxis sp. TaxID=1908224 RepID=UPI001A34BCFC|nr:DUF736 domain-containing protein [Sphingopyxis sp.]MBJ7499676.1 DUF736 domain-containing protein [Sphingopyxis sp.]